MSEPLTDDEIEARLTAALERRPGRVTIDIHGGEYTIWESVEEATRYLAKRAAFLPPDADPEALNVERLARSIEAAVNGGRYIDISDSLDFDAVPEVAAAIAREYAALTVKLREVGR